MTDNGALEGKLTPRQRRFEAALMAAPDVRAAAQVAGIGERTAWRYMANPAIRRSVATRQAAALAQVASGLVDDMTEARALLRGVVTDETAAQGVRVRAALGILDAGLRLAELVTMAERVAILEARLEARP